MRDHTMANWKRCTRRDKSQVYLNLGAEIAIKSFDEGFSRVYFGAGSGDNKLYFDVMETVETLIPSELSSGASILAIGQRTRR
jgi:hypothetical protein